MTVTELREIVLAACEEFRHNSDDRYAFYGRLIGIAGISVAQDAMGVDDAFDDAVDDAEPS